MFSELSWRCETRVVYPQCIAKLTRPIIQSPALECAPAVTNSFIIVVLMLLHSLLVFRCAGTFVTVNPFQGIVINCNKIIIKPGFFFSLGKHELRKNVPCHLTEVSSGNQCGKPLICNRHTCLIQCRVNMS